MRNPIVIACIIVITAVNVVCAVLCVRNASLANRSLPQLVPEIEAIKTTIDQQNSVLNRAIGNVVPVKMPADFENQLRALEAIVNDKNKWPKTQSESDDLVNELKFLIKQLPAWADSDYRPRINPLAWSIQSLSVLGQYAVLTDDNLDPAISAIDPLLDGVPDGASPDILAALKSKLADLDQAASSSKRDQAIAQANLILKHKSGDAIGAWSVLEKWVDDPSKGNEVQTLRAALRKQALAADADQQAAILANKEELFSALPDEKLSEQGLIGLYYSAVSRRVSLAAEGLPPSPALDEVANSLQQNLATLAKKA